MSRWDLNGDYREGFPSGVRVSDADVALRAHHVEFLESISERTGSTISLGLSRIIARHVVRVDKVPERKAEVVRKHFVFLPAHLSLIDRLACKFGVQRSDIIRRLIDEAIAREASISSLPARAA